ncbi:MAG: DinB family protein [Pyrinomonadaceae bacterium]
MKQYLLETFQYNDYANKLALAKIRELPEKDECIKYFSHLIRSMNKWLSRVEQTPGYAELDWWTPVYPLDDLEPKWDECLKRWLEFIESKSEEELLVEVEFIGFDGYDFAAVIKDIALQLNYHSIHHRAQIQYLIRQQGIEPQFVDYIGTKYRRL